MCCINAKIPPHEKSEILSNLKKGGTKGACVKTLSTGSIMERMDSDVTPIVYFGVFGQH
jgi:hypothetical protein